MTTFRYSNRHGLYLPQQEDLSARKVPKASLGDAAKAIKKFFADHGQALNPQSGLGKIVQAAEKAARLKPDDIVFPRDAFDSQLVLEIQPALAVLEGHPKVSDYLAKLVTGCFSTYDKGRSIAKDTYWEIDVCHKLRKAGLSVKLDDPDVIWTDQEEPVPIECKKIYSHARLEKALSKGVSQVAKRAGVGFVAVNIDELVPGTLQVKSWQATDIQPQKLLSDFYARHDRHFRKYLRQGRLSGTVVACFVRVEIIQSNGRLGRFYTQQWQYFTNPELPAQHSRRATLLREAIGRLTAPDERA